MAESENEPAGSPPQPAPDIAALLAAQLASANAIVAEMHTLLVKISEAAAGATTQVAKAQEAVNVATEAQRKLATAVSESQTKAAEVSAVATQALASQSAINDQQAVIATKSAHINDAQTHADGVRAELDRRLTAATTKATEAEAQFARAQAASDGATEALNKAKGSAQNAEHSSAAAALSQTEADTAATATKAIAARAASVDARVAEYEATLHDLKSQADRQLTTITELLPGATSAGLASAFDDRRKTFIKPSNRWQWTFVGSVVALILLAATGVWKVYQAATPLTYDELARLWLARLPIAASLIWLAMHASRESALAKRLEEDYGFKAVIAASFQGFQKQMAELGSNVAADSPLGRLSTDTLATIASPPGRIYDGHKLIVSPTAVAAEAVKTALAAKAAGTEAVKAPKPPAA